MSITISNILNRVTQISEICADPIVISLRNDLEAQLREDAARQNHSLSALKTITAMLNPKYQPREGLRYPWIDSEGRQCVCDGFQAYRLKNHLPLQERPDNVGEGVRLENIFPATLDGYKRLDLPTAKEIRAEITLQRAKWTSKARDFLPKWDFGPDAPTVNAQYLLNAVTVFPNAREIFWDTIVHPMVITCDEGDGLILPIRDANKAQPVPTETKRVTEADKARAEQAEREDAEREAAIPNEQDERDEIIRKAKDEYGAIRKEVIRLYKELTPVRQAWLKTPDNHSPLSPEIIAKQKELGDLMIRGYAAESVWNPDMAWKPDTLVHVVMCLNGTFITAAA